MKRCFKNAALVTALGTALGMFGTAAFAAGVTVKIGDPGYYGRLELDGAPQPVLISPEPIVIERERVVEQPAYVYVPVDQRNNWADNCATYEACARPVYFVEERWYNDVYVPHYRSKHDIKQEAKQDYRDAKREAKDIKRDAKREYKDTKREIRDLD